MKWESFSLKENGLPNRFRNKEPNKNRINSKKINFIITVFVVSFFGNSELLPSESLTS